jgi:hypothetical protein
MGRKGGPLRAIEGRVRIHWCEEVWDPIGAVMHFAAEHGCPPSDVWFSTNHEDSGFQTLVRIISLADVIDHKWDLGALGPERKFPAAAEMAAADALLDYLGDYIQWSW